MTTQQTQEVIASMERIFPRLTQPEDFTNRFKKTTGMDKETDTFIDWFAQWNNAQNANN